MKYLVLRGNHPAFRDKDFTEINWYRYKQRDEVFDYKSITTARFKFLERKMLNKHLIEDLMDKEYVEIDFLHGGAEAGQGVVPSTL